MSLPRFYVPEFPSGGLVHLSDEDARHALQVLRMRPGDQLSLFNGLGLEANGCVQQCGRSTVEVQLTNVQSILRELPGHLELIVSLPKGDRQKLLVDSLVQLGVHRLTPLLSQRSVAQPTEQAIQRLRRTVIESSKQCGRNQLMDVQPAIELKKLAELAQHKDPVLMMFAHPYGSSPSLLSLLQQHGTGERLRVSDRGPATKMLVGPEGGLSDSECQLLIEQGWQPVQLGPRILRIETAAVMLAATWAAWQAAEVST